MLVFLITFANSLLVSRWYCSALHWKQWHCI